MSDFMCLCNHALSGLKGEEKLPQEQCGKWLNKRGTRC